MLFYAPTEYPSIYAELCNFTRDAGDAESSKSVVHTLYSQLDGTALAYVVGPDRARALIDAKPGTTHVLAV